MKKVLSIMVIFVLLFSLAGCGSEDETVTEEATELEESSVDVDGEQDEDADESADETEEAENEDEDVETASEEAPADKQKPEKGQEGTGAPATEIVAEEDTTTEAVSDSVEVVETTEMSDTSDYLDIFQTAIDSSIITESEAVELTAFMEANTPDASAEAGGPPSGGRPEGGQPSGESEDGEMPEGQMPEGESTDGERPGGRPQDGEMVRIFTLAAEEGIITTDQAEALDASIEMPEPGMQ